MYGIKKRHLVTILVLVFPIIVTFLPPPAPESIRSRTTRFFKAPLTIANNFSHKLQDVISPKGFFSRQLRSQKLQMQALQLENSKITETFLENQRLKELLSFKQTLLFSTTPVQIIAKDPSNWRHTIIIDKGAASGVKKNQFLISQQGLVGRICEVGKSAAKAILLTDPDFRVAAICQRNREQMIVVGTARNLCAMKYLAQDADLKVNDIIVTSGLGGFCPKGIIIGEVTSVRKSSDGFTKEAYLVPAVQLSRLEEALVLMEGQKR